MASSIEHLVLAIGGFFQQVELHALSPAVGGFFGRFRERGLFGIADHLFIDREIVRLLQLGLGHCDSFIDAGQEPTENLVGETDVAAA